MGAVERNAEEMLLFPVGKVGNEGKHILRHCDALVPDGIEPPAEFYGGGDGADLRISHA